MRFRSISKIWKFVLLNECMPAIGRKKVAAVWPRQVKCCSCIHCAILSTYHSQSFIAYVALSSLVQNKTFWELSDICTRICRTFARAQEIFFAQKLFAQDQNWGSELCRPRTCRTSGSRRATFATFYSRRAIMEDHTEHLLYTENDGEIWFEISAVHNVDIVAFFFPGGFRQMPVLPLPPSSQDFPHPLVHW